MDSILSVLGKHRSRILTALVLFLLFGVGGWFLTPLLLRDLSELLDVHLIQTMVAEALTVRIVLAAVIGAGLTLFLAGLLWLKKPGFCLLCAGLFLCGLAFGRFLLLPQTIRMLLSLLPESFGLHLSVWNYVMFCLLFELLLGCVFGEPIIVWLLYRLHLVSGRSLQSKRKPVYLAMLILLAILTPTQDALTLILSMLPLVLLYELSALVLILAERKNKERAYADA